MKTLLSTPDGAEKTTLVSVASSAGVPATNEAAVRNLIDLWLSQLAETSRSTYAAAVKDFAHFLTAESVDQAIRRLLGAGKGSATAIVMAYRAEMTEARGLSPATCNLRVAALRSLIGQANELGLIDWTIKVRALKSKSYRDTAGPGVPNVRKMLRDLRARGDTKGLRDVALLRCMFDLGLRRAEIIGLDLEHIEDGRLWIKGKGQRERQAVTLPEPTREALAAWVRVRGNVPGPVFVSLSNNSMGHRLTGQAVHQVVAKLGKSLGIVTSPHRVRHSAVSTAAGLPGEGLLEAQRFARHSDPRVTLIYIDALEDIAGRVARQVAAAV